MYIALGVFFLVLGVTGLLVKAKRASLEANKPSSTWNVRSIDTMKYSRDLAREKATDEKFATTINEMVEDIANTGATHVAVGTPYSAEFVPYLTLWVDAARRNDINVWFRGNIPGWEGWFEYAKIDREEHKELLKAFLLKNPQLFENGDIFSPCPECENGGSGDPRFTGDVEGFRQFLIDETELASEIFAEQNVSVMANYHSMNGDVAKLVMDPKTTKTLGGVVVVDHYVASADQLVLDVAEYAEMSEGKIILGEFGAPIPDLHGKMTESEQAAWIADALEKLGNEKSLIGINYWVNSGGTTALWKENGSAREAVEVLSQYYE